MGGKMMRSIGL